MTKTIGDNQGRIGYLESLNKQLEGTVQVKNQQSEQVRSVPIAILRSGRGVPIPTDPAFPLLLHDNPASRTSVISLSRVPFSFTILPTVPRFWRIKLPEKRSNPVSRQEILRFPESRTIFHRVITRSRKCQEEKLFLGLGEKTHCLRLFWPPDSKIKQIMNSFIHHHYLLCVNGTCISRIFKLMCEWVLYKVLFYCKWYVLVQSEKVPELGVLNNEVYF